MWKALRNNDSNADHLSLCKAHKAMISAAVSSTPGVSHIFYTSLAFGGKCTPVSVASVMQAHLATESYLKALALHPPNKKPFTFTAIREGIYSESFPLYTGFFDLQNPSAEVKIPHDGFGAGIAWAKRDELGEATARIVQDYCYAPAYRYARAGKYEYLNMVILLSGPRVLRIAETLWQLAEITKLQEKVKITRVTQQEFTDDPKAREVLGSHGPEDPAKLWTSTFEALRAGECAILSGELERWLGRRPEEFRETVKKMMNEESERVSGRF